MTDLTPAREKEIRARYKHERHVLELLAALDAERARNRELEAAISEALIVREPAPASATERLAERMRTSNWSGPLAEDFARLEVRIADLEAVAEAAQNVCTVAWAKPAPSESAMALVLANLATALAVLEEPQ